MLVELSEGLNPQTLSSEKGNKEFVLLFKLTEKFFLDLVFENPKLYALNLSSDKDDSVL